MKDVTGKEVSHPMFSPTPPTKVKRGKIVSAEEAVRVIRDGDTVATGGFVGTGFAEEIAVKLELGEHTDYRDVDIAIRDAFDEARRQLEDYARRQRGQVKAHEPASHARVARLFPEAGYGFLETPDGREVYFHRNSVLGANFEDLEVGTEVRFVEELGDKGPQASTVTPVGRHSHL